MWVGVGVGGVCVWGGGSGWGGGVLVLACERGLVKHLAMCAQHIRKSESITR